jgi:valyl-tRNA synthetase
VIIITNHLDFLYFLQYAALAAYLPSSPATVTAAQQQPKTSKKDKDTAGEGEDTQKLSKSALKKLAKGKNKKKEKPQWGDGSKKKESKASKAKKNDKETVAFVNTTPKGHKKDVKSIPMSEAYQPEAVEAAWQDWWEHKGFYSCDPKDAMGKSPSEDKFVMVIPPPNVTGSLHLGHALTAAVEDTLTRWHRMCGHATLYVPGELELGKESRIILLTIKLQFIHIHSILIFT